MRTTDIASRFAAIPDWFRSIDWNEVGFSVLIVGGAVALGYVALPLVFRLLERWTRRTDSPVDDKALQYLRRPLRWLLPLIALRLALPLTAISPEGIDDLNHALFIGVIFAVAWLLWRTILMIEDLLVSRFHIDAADNLRARKIQTQIRGIRNIAAFLLWVLAGALALTTFETVRQFGVTLLASAGVAGIIIGFAAQRSISTIIAGIQIAMTQPIRVDDVVIVEGEWGRIEEITLTYVVIKIWDLRRLIVPINYFIEKPFQNWTRTEAELLGSVFIDTDYSVPVDALRDELDRILDGNPRWDGEVKSVVVTEAGSRTMQIRALVSAANSGDAWDLRCEVREKLIAFLREDYPGSLPRVRAEIAGQTSRADTATTAPTS